MNQCVDCIYAAPVKLSEPSGEQKCRWNHQIHSPDHCCVIHSFFPKKHLRESKPERSRSE